MKTTAQTLHEVRKFHAHQGPKVIRAYVLASFRFQAGIEDVPNSFATFRWASYCWTHKLGPTYKPFLIG